MEPIINSWVKVSYNVWMLAVEASMAAPMRAMRIMTGGKKELSRVIDESRQAVAALPEQAETGRRRMETGLRALGNDMSEAVNSAAADVRDLVKRESASRTLKVAEKAARKATRLIAEAPKQAAKAIKTQRAKVKIKARRATKA